MVKLLKSKIEKEVVSLRKKIAQLQKLEAKCRHSESKYKQLEHENAKLLQTIETTKEAICVTSNDGTITHTNSAMDELFGYGKGELIGKKPSVLIAGPTPVKVMNNIVGVLKKEGYWEGETHDKRKDGTKFISYSRICVFKDGRGNIINFLSTQHDITEHDYMKHELKESVNKLQNVLEETIRAIALTIEKRDLFTAGHQRRVAELASAIAKAMKLPEDRITGVYMAGLLHDIGKINIPAELLMKPAKLTELEFKLIKNHPKVAYDILKGIEFPWPIAKFSLQHHERMDGSGYPDGLKNKDIALESRILAVADVVEAMSSARPYRPALGVNKALEEISSKKGLLYDADVVDICIKLFNEKGFKFK
ncbi:MAG: HD domain-containing protein [Candidatus Omnitrophica bacterium]|nr:HD domain-containing protein [Candidatus Omnitrophota bacterium]MBU1047265.1 HD domain-containing protein [Candidatus Omnitrophota bacterium]MBU1889150.1 HD domain-containing protein [Candidatus Omnitrophota bacterium]